MTNAAPAVTGITASINASFLRRMSASGEIQPPHNDAKAAPVVPSDLMRDAFN
jgi:hypothetical protein